MSLNAITPGNCSYLEENWNCLIAGTDTTITVVQADRWEHSMYYNSDPGVLGFYYSNHCGFLVDDQMWEFDHNFFEMTPEEVIVMDPTCRKGLESAYGSLMRAGFTKKTLLGKRLGIYIGCSGSDWPGTLAGTIKGDIHAYSSTTTDFVATRISHRLGLRGPTQVHDTACSSSLVALNVGFWTLRPVEPGQMRITQGEQAKWTLMQGCNAQLGPFSWIGLCGPKMLSPRGRCFTFDHSADGFNRAEGFNGCTMKALDSCEDETDSLARACGGCVNQDGRSASMTAPHGPSQQECIRSSLRESNLTPADIRMTELHGTGTALGDPIEVGALRGVMKTRTLPIVKTSGKSNYGHLEANAGVTGYTKCVMMLNYGCCAPNCHLNMLNANIDMHGYPVIINDLGLTTGSSGFAGVSSFGFGGTNGRGDIWGRALKGPYATGGDWLGMDKLAYVRGRAQDLKDRGMALDDPDFSQSFKDKCMLHARADYARSHSKIVADDWRLKPTDWLGKVIPQEEAPLPIGPGSDPEWSLVLDMAKHTTPSGLPFTLRMAIDMMTELMTAYSEPDFQAAMIKAFIDNGGDPRKTNAARKELFSPVQEVVLPKYGFEATPRGVQESLQGTNAYLSSPKIIELNNMMGFLNAPEGRQPPPPEIVEFFSRMAAGGGSQPAEAAIQMASRRSKLTKEMVSR